jgi:hypothetical protein
MDDLRKFLTSIISNNITPGAWTWLQMETSTSPRKGGDQKFNIAFVAMPRKTGKGLVKVSAQEEDTLRALRPGLTVKGWTVDRLCRAWLLMQFPSGDKTVYTNVIENLFLNAEMGEQVALYSSLPLLPFPEFWKKRCAEGIRSNIGQVLESIICHNPYPAEQLDEAAWNQLVLKAIFTEKPVLEIYGLENRANQRLADSLSDYAHERWAAHRPVNPLLWICVTRFVNERIFPDIEKIFSSENAAERQAAALVCYHSKYSAAKKLLEQNETLKSSIERGEISWASIAMSPQATVDSLR